ncbi:penicillin-binding protein 2 [Enterobacteriaceae endosymbiont of Macroplea mutica]|uniref:penicillin-binding protein 2 n=1 Tax=Enterobacteriaceae endosymbiont of Macroplea mutica TaxID=2675791 RepID=UPI001449855C|nr:penicillin-binding protein 2 [Enterobacteriaceae endosymbiont of Macroplea mutica]QJC31314.1 penicillin-binding protein 2 [Enterobacteriaceae endosymbiont of Macroplea mutica]
MKFNKYIFHSYKASHYKTFLNRILLACMISILLVIILLYNLYYLQITLFQKYNIASQNNYSKLVKIIPNRGFIYDRNNIPLAINQAYYQLIIIPRNMTNIQNTTFILKKILNITININEINNLKKKHRNNDTIPIVLMKNLNEKQIAMFVANKYRLPGVYLQTYMKRLYPFGSLFAHTVGYVTRMSAENNISNIDADYHINNIPFVGKVGIEQYYENILHGKIGYKKNIMNNKGHIIYQNIIQHARNGNDIYLTLDVKLQKYITSLISNYRIAIIISNPQNGDVLALISNPTFNPNLFSHNITQKQFNILKNNPHKPLLNRVTQGIYPPASTVKPYLAIAALTEGIVNPHTIIFDPGWWKIPMQHQLFKDWKRYGHGYINIVHALTESSDVFFYKVAYNMGIDKIFYWMSQFGFGRKTNIDLNNEIPGNLPNKYVETKKKHIQWHIGDTISVGIGQSYWNATPIQINKMLTILINNGVLKKLHILQSLKINNNKCSIQPKPIKIINNINKQFWHLVKQGMYRVAHTRRGTMYIYFRGAKYKIAAKTGTAQVYNLKNKHINNVQRLQNKLSDHKLIIAFAPINNPTVAISIVIENHNNREIILGHLIRKIFDYIFQHHKDFNI